MAKDSPKPRNVYVDDELWAWVKARAAAEGRTVSAVIRDALAATRSRTAGTEGQA